MEQNAKSTSVESVPPPAIEKSSLTTDEAEQVAALEDDGEESMMATLSQPGVSSTATKTAQTSLLQTDMELYRGRRMVCDESGCHETAPQARAKHTEL